MIILPHLIHLHTVNVSEILPLSKHLSTLLWFLHLTQSIELAFWLCLVQSLEPGFMLCQFLQLSFGWTMMSSESQLVFVLVSQCAILTHVCSCCGVEVNNLGTHGLSCRFSKGRHSHHVALNDIIKRALDSARIPCHLEPSGLYRSDGKCSDGASVVPWRCGKILL